ncbi:hypothetical protein PFISCL1PPCAC_1481, partial [Pristionchus fissidentatus]
GGACSENTCRVGFKCDDSTTVGAKCIPFDTRARSSCAEIRCRPGWSCVIAMDGPRCYRNQVLGVTDAPPPAPTEASTDAHFASDYSIIPISGKTCADVTCPYGLSCFEADSSNTEPFCRNDGAGRDSIAPQCSEVQCGPDESCSDSSSGPSCSKNAPATCAATSCLVGTRCVEYPEGARCEGAVGPPQVLPGKTCADSACPDMHQCFDTVDGANCVPIPTDPVLPGPLNCAQLTCGEGETCTDDENGGVCAPAAEGKLLTVSKQFSDYFSFSVKNYVDYRKQTTGSSSDDCEHKTCGSGELCAIDFEGKPYCRAEERTASDVPSSNSVSTPDHIPLCSEITCPDKHECFDDSVKGAACWPMRK